MRGQAKEVSAEEAISKISSGATLAVGGFVGTGHPEFLTAALEQYFLKRGTPRDLTLFYVAGQGDRKNRGLNHLAHEGLIKRVIGGHWNLAPKLGKLALENKIEAYNFPQGVLCVLLREIAAKRPGIFTRVGMNTFIDPRQDGGRLNARTRRPLVELVTLGGEEWLWYRSIPIHVGLVRGTRADRRGNISFEREGLVGEVLPIAQAAKNHGGIVIVQAEEIVDSIADPKAIRVPGILVDYVVVSDKAHHMQTFDEAFNPDYLVRQEGVFTSQIEPFSERKIIGRRVLREIRKGDLVNLGIGLPEMVAIVAAEEKRLEDFTLTVESGPIGGVPASGLSFGCSRFPEAVLDQPSQFDFYDGGGLDCSALGAVEIDVEGSVNVTHFAGRFAGIGGFANIAQNARRLIFCGTFRAGDLEVDVQEGKLVIVKEGRHCKFVRKVAQVSFHGPSALARGQEVFYVTERAVFRLTPKGLELVEVAPGILIQEQILELMEFQPVIGIPAQMPNECFEK